ncbi:MAG TPA: hypothetical protein VJN42_07565 [Candidatus Acidoferrum sp.]|nr:hypothetical protein [Candidatus Acidoferrum sp.]
MRLKLGYLMAAALLAGGAAAVHASTQQNPQTMMPEESEAKAKQVIQDLINARGGAGYLEARDSECQGTRAQFGHSEDLTGYVAFTEYREAPDKDRIEFNAKSHNLKNILNTMLGVDGLDLAHGGTIVAVYNGDRGWALDRGGVSELPATSIADFQESVKRNIDNVLRVRLKEAGWTYRYGGSGTANLKEVEWVELTDSEQRTFRLAVDRNTRLLVQSVVTTNNEQTRDRDEDITDYTNYQLKDTVWTPMKVARQHNGRRITEFFYDSCRFNSAFPSDFFDKASLGKKAGAKKN